jgi:hypothetical protein
MFRSALFCLCAAMFFVFATAGLGKTGDSLPNKAGSRVGSSSDYTWDNAAQRKNEITKRAEKAYQQFLKKAKSDKEGGLKYRKQREKKLKQAVKFQKAAERKGEVLADYQKSLEASIKRKLDERAKLNRKKREQRALDEEDN